MTPRSKEPSNLPPAVTLDTLPPFLDIPEFAAALNISRGLAYEMVKRGDISVIRCGRLIRIPKSVVARLLEEPLPVAKIRAVP